MRVLIGESQSIKPVNIEKVHHTHVRVMIKNGTLRVLFKENSQVHDWESPTFLTTAEIHLRARPSWRPARWGSRRTLRGMLEFVWRLYEQSLKSSALPKSTTCW